ncbi:MAG: methyl-accepting chemotaxis protein [bacterium]
MFKTKSLAFKLSTYILIVIFIIASVVFITYYFVSKDIILQNVEENAKNLTFNNVNKIERILKSIEKVTESIATVLEKTTTTETELDSLIKSIVANNDEIFGCSVAFEPYAYSPNIAKHAPYYFKNNYTVNKINLGKESFDYFYYDWYQIPKVLRKSVWNEPYYDEDGKGILKSTYSVPFYKTTNAKKYLTGIITVNISLDWLQEIVSKVKIYQTGYAFLINNRGTFITFPEKGKILNESIFSVAEEMNLPLLRKIGRKMLKGESGFIFNEKIINKENCWICYAPLKSSDWSMAVLIPQEELYADLYFLNKLIIIIGVIGFIILFATITAISRSMTLPLRKVTEIASEISTGKISLAVSKIKEYQLKTESFNWLINNNEKSDNEIFTLFNAVKKMTFDLNLLLTRVAESSDNVIILKNKITSSIRQLEATVTEQAASTNEVNATTNQISATVRDLANTINNVTKVSIEAADSSNEGLKNLDEIKTTMYKLSESVNKISEKLDNINSKTTNIFQIITTITKIADKTNLLSLNTAIESEKAGNYGAGFSVIAQEIRRLADQTAISTLDIETIIYEMQSSVKEGVDTVKLHTEQTVKSTNKINSLSSNLSKVLEQSQKLSPQYEIVNHGMQQQSQGAEQISDAMGQLNVVAKQTKKSLIELNDITIELNKAISVMQDEIGKFSL